MRDARVLLVEGRSAGEASLANALRKVGIEVHVANTGLAALSALDGFEPHVIVFDASSLRSSGVRTVSRLRRAARTTPIVHCQGASSSIERSPDIEVYLRRPFTSRKLLNRIRALLPANPMNEPVVRAGPITVFCRKRSIMMEEGSEHHLTPKQFDLLLELLRHAGQVLERAHIMREVWHTEYVGDTRTLDVHVSWLREKIERDTENPRILRTARGVGYVLDISALVQDAAK